MNLPSDNEKRLIAADTMYNFFKHAIEISNANTIHNADHLLRKSEKDLSNIKWTNKSNIIFDESNVRFKSIEELKVIY